MNLEIWFDKKFFFPYKYLDYIANDLTYYNGFAIYFVMSAPKLKISKAIFTDNQLITTYWNNSANKEITIKNSIFSFPIADEFVKLDIHKFAYSITIKLLGDARNYLIGLGENSEFIDSLVSNGLKFDIFALIMKNNNASLDEFTLLYIGQSKNLIERLESHKTIQKICRECDLEYNDFEILIMALHPKTKKFDRLELQELLLQELFGNSSVNNGEDLITGINSNEVLDAAEIILIQTFRPKYNIMHKESSPNKKQKKYNCFYNEGVSNVSISLDLKFDCDIMVLQTNSFSTQGNPGWLLECPVGELSSNKNVEIRKESIGFEIY